MNEAKLAELLQNEEFLLKIVQLKTTSAVQEAFKQEGLDISEDEVYELGKMLKYAIKSNKTELSAEELEEVAGGSKTGKTIAKVVAGATAVGVLVAVGVYIKDVYDRIYKENTVKGWLAQNVAEPASEFLGTKQPSLWEQGVRIGADYVKRNWLDV